MFVAINRLTVALGLIFSLVLPLPAAAAGTTVSALVCQNSFDPVTLVASTPSPTGGVSADMSGTANANAHVVLMVNAVPKASLSAAQDGTFAATVPLVIGPNTIAAVADDGACGHTGNSPDVVVDRFQVPPPAPQIAAPSTGSTTTASSVLVQGTAEVAAGVAVMVGGVVKGTVTIGVDGTFSITVPLALGANAIIAQATNPAGTGPLSAAVTVTSLAPPTPRPTPTPGPSAPVPPPPVPQIVSPSGGTTTTATSVMVTVAGQPGALVTVTVGGQTRATVTIGADDTAQVTIALDLGQNQIVATVNGHSSAPVAVTREAPPPQAPVITSPHDGFSTSAAVVTVSGRAQPSEKVDIYNDKGPVASVTSDDTGQFSAQIALHAGFNLIYTAISPPGLDVLRSQSVQVERTQPGAGPTASASGIISRGFKNLITIPAAAAVLTLQAAGEVLGAMAASPVISVLVFGISGFVATGRTGLIGLELLLLLPGLLRSLLHLVRFGRVVRGQVIDSVTGRPLSHAQVAVGQRGQKIHVISGPGGKFTVPATAVEGAFDLTVKRPGYEPAAATHGGVAADIAVVPLEPSAARRTSLVSLLDLTFGTFSWLSMLLAAALAIYLAVHQPALPFMLLAAVSVSLIAINLGALIGQPHYRWGKLTDSNGSALAGATLSLTDSSGVPVSSYLTDATGRYTLYAHGPGEYRLKVRSGEAVVHEEEITVRQRAAYLGFPLMVKSEA